MQLEERINQYLDKNSETPYRVKVTNFARGGSSSPFQFEMLKAAFPEEGPDVIISMLGINDSNLMAVDHYSLYKMSYLTRFLYWSYIAYKCPNCYRDGIRDTTGHGTAINQKETYAINDTNHLQNTFSQAVDSALAGPDPEKQLEQAFISYKEKFAALRARHPEATHMVGGEAGNRLFALSQKPAFHKKFQTFRSDILSYGEQLFEEFKDTAVFVHPAYLQHACHIKWA
ncbi:MAG: hypothetical protein RBT63_09890, partial [Bdellovibrionales bacterium]|nr:hypothetical protein [Bdellovibrionales bacterium]